MENKGGENQEAEGVKEEEEEEEEELPAGSGGGDFGLVVPQRRAAHE